MEVLVILIVGVLWLVANIAEAISPSHGGQQSPLGQLPDGKPAPHDPLRDDQGHLTLDGYARIDGLDGTFDGQITPQDWFFKQHE